jgi:hypothetical protein
MLTIIVDSYDHAKMSLPKWPMMRTPKRSLFENTRRHPIALCHIEVCGFMVFLCISYVPNFQMILHCSKFVMFGFHETKVRISP